MQLPKLISLFSLLLIIFGFSSIENQYEPVFMYRSEMENAIRLEGPKMLENPGKIYIKDHCLFIVEQYRGIHVIDNSNPEDPDKVGFIHIDGCIDLAVKGDVLYADNAVDLLAIKLAENLASIEVTSRNKNVFPEFKAPDGRSLSFEEEQARPANAVLVRWKNNWQ